MINNQTALLVIDVQNGLAQAADFNSLIAKINQRIKSYREKDQPIIFMQHTDAELPYGSPAWMLAAKLAVQNEDQIFLKYHSDSFF
jgi:nicotinamidase-related amidase